MGNFNNILKQDELFSLLIDSNMIGYSINLNYSKMTILTNDFWKRNAKGIPHNSFLIATSIDINNLVNTKEIDEEIILLRVTSEYDLPSSDVWLEAKIDKFKNLQSNTELSYDEFSQNEMQYSGLECRVLGTFFKNGDGNLTFGADIENYYGTQILKVYKPSSSSLERIINYRSKKANINKIESTPKEIGEIRFTSSNRLQNADKKAKVFVDPDDFIARRTAMFGMTRTGKSNTVKTLLKAISETAKKNNKRISQIIYDINGEYANPNIDDKGAIATDIVGSYVFSLNSNIDQNEHIQTLQFDFFNELGLAHEFIVNLLKTNNTSSSTDMQTFINMDITSYLPENIDNTDFSMATRAKWIRATYMFILYKVLGSSKKKTIRNPFSKSILSQISKDDTEGKEISFDTFEEILNALHDNRKTVKTSSSLVYKDDFENLINIAVCKNSNGGQFLGYGHIKKVQPNRYHCDNSENYVNKILQLVKNGETIILDLSIGDENMRNLISESIARKIFQNNMLAYTKGITPDFVIFYIEEAHNLIGKEMDLKEIWPRIAKEGAKYKIGLVYSTQEPSSINKNILSNTENWFVTHLNNEDEIRTLSKFYDFSDFKNSILMSKDVGFSRVKTLSQNFVLPVQIKLYESGE
ncbi:DUF87 domain-containing protein [Clostridium malenominatum]|uniref:DUF87 domain-containing protein n=1 Tax=Clostridium malenominatum TaxID=1539 RepID=A0ABN1IKS5_9CLOT